MNLPYELVIKILVEFDGRFVLRKGKLIFINKLLKDDLRYTSLFPVMPHPNLVYCRRMGRILPQVYLKFSPEKEYVLSLWIEDDDVPVTDVLLSTKINEWKITSVFIGIF